MLATIGFPGLALGKGALTWQSARQLALIAGLEQQHNAHPAHL